MTKISRRNLIKALAISLGGISAYKLLHIPLLKGNTQELESYFLPNTQKGPPGTPTTEPTQTGTPTPTSTSPTPTHTVTPSQTPTPTPTSGTPAPPPDEKVVHVHSESATFWNGQTDYWNYVASNTVDAMVDEGMMELTGTTNLTAAWQAIIPGYQNGDAIAIKVNCNNAMSCNDTDGQIDALPQPVDAIVRGLTQAGVAEADIWIFEARRRIPDRFVNGISYNGVQYFDHDCRIWAGFDSNDPNAIVTFNPPGGIPMPPTTRITDVMINAKYLINVPIIKTHGLTGVTLTFKNHFGTINQPAPLHPYVGMSEQYYQSDYSLFVDLYLNPHIVGKTVLILADALFGAKDGTTSPPATWQTFNGQVPNSLFFSLDPVAIDCVMCDFLAAEVALPDHTDDYLGLASDAGLGVYERGDPWGSGYSLIDYYLIEM